MPRRFAFTISPPFVFFIAVIRFLQFRLHFSLDAFAFRVFFFIAFSQSDFRAIRSSYFLHSSLIAIFSSSRLLLSGIANASSIAIFISLSHVSFSHMTYFFRQFFIATAFTFGQPGYGFIRISSVLRLLWPAFAFPSSPIIASCRFQMSLSFHFQFSVSSHAIFTHSLLRCPRCFMITAFQHFFSHRLGDYISLMSFALLSRLVFRAVRHIFDCPFIGQPSSIFHAGAFVSWLRRQTFSHFPHRLSQVSAFQRPTSMPALSD